MPTLDPRTHIIRPGDTLTSIARHYGFPDWQILYSAECNQRLRQLRPNPNFVKAGDVILIPPSPTEVKEVLRERAQRLKQLRVESETMFAKIEAELLREKQEFLSKTKNIDVVGKVATVAVSLGSLVRDGFSAMKLSGEALEAANGKLAKAGVKFAYEPLIDPAATAAAEKLQAHKGIRYHFGTAFHILANLTTPSYWAGVYTNTKDGKSVGQILNSRPETLMNDQVNQIRQQRKQTLERLDQSIRELERGLTGDVKALYSPANTGTRFA